MQNALALNHIACINVLLVPVQPIRRDTYAKHCKLIRQFTKIPIRDVPTDPRGPSAQLSALPTSTGNLLLSFLDVYSRSQRYLEEFQLSRRILGIIGVVDCTEWDDLQDCKLEFDRLLKQHPQVLATRCYAFDPAEEQKDDVEGVVVIPSVGDLQFYMNTLLADFSASLLHGLSDLACALDKRTVVEGPSETIIPDVMAALNARTSMGAISRTSTPEPIRRSSTPLPAETTEATKRFSTLPDPALLDKSNRRKMQGRVLKLKGDLRCLAGRWAEATTLYNEAITISKTTADDVWHAGAAENLILLQAMSVAAGVREQSLPNGISEHLPATGVSSLRELPDRYLQVLGLYEKSLSQPPTDDASVLQEATPALIYAEACLKAARIQLCAWRVGGWNAKALATMMQPSLSTDSPPRPSDFARLSALSTVQRFTVAELASQALTKALETIAVTDRLAVLNSVASVFGTLNYLRKRATVLREISALLSDAIRRARIAASAPLNPDGVVRSSPQTEGNQSIISILDKICEAYGFELIERLVVGSKQAAEKRRQSVIGFGTQSAYSTETIGSSEDTTRATEFGWPALQVSIARDAVQMASMIAEHQAMLRYAVSALRALNHVMPPLEQYELSQSIPETFQAASRRGAQFQLDFWGPVNFVMSIEVSPLSPARYPHTYIGKSVSTQSSDPTSTFYSFDPKKETRNIDLNNVCDHFSPMPTTIDRDAIQTFLVQDEPVDMLVTLQNTFMFDLHIESIELSTSGVSFKAQSISVTLPSASYHTIHLTGIPLESGQLNVRGCKVRLEGSLEREFVLPSWSSRKRPTSRPISLELDEERIKDNGLINRKRTSRIDTLETTSNLPFLQCTVFPEQPILSIKSTSFTHGSMMLYDGERAECQIQVENVSSMRINHLDLVFEDAHTMSTLARLHDHEVELPPGEAYELDHDLRTRPVFSWSRPAAGIQIEPGQSCVLRVECFGKLECTKALIQIIYGQSTEPDGLSFVRKLDCPVQLTVHRALTPQSMLFQLLRELPSSASTSHSMKRSATQTRLRAQSVTHVAAPLEASLRTVSAGKHCLLLIDVKNLFGQPFELQCEAQAGVTDFESFTLSQRIEPGATSSLLVRLSRIRLPPSQLSERPIPPPQITRQYVVPDRQKSMLEADKALEQELFWCREHILNSIKVSWREIGTRRHGIVSLRSLRLSEDMLAILKAPAIDIQAFVVAQEAGSVRRKAMEDHWQLSINTFVDVSLDIQHDLERPLIVHIGLSISAAASIDSEEEHYEPLHSSPHVLLDGATLSIPLEFDSGNRLQQKVPLCFLSTGLFRLVAVVTEMADEGRPVQRFITSRKEIVLHVK